MSKLYHYFVEGECEEKFINMYKVPPQNFFQPGKVEVFNFINNTISNQRIIRLKPNTNIILVYDTDVDNDAILKSNIAKLKENGFHKIFHVHSVKSFEDEIVFSTKLNNINSFFGTLSVSEFKDKFLRAGNKGLIAKFKGLELSLNKLWSRQGIGVFKKYETKKGIEIMKNKK